MVPGRKQAENTRETGSRGRMPSPVRPGRTCTGSAIWMYADGRRRVDPVNGAARAGGEAAAAAWPASREKLVAPCPASRRGTERPPPGRQVGLGGKWPASDLSVLDLDRLGSLARSQPQGTSMDGVVRMRTWTLTEDGAAGAIRLFRFFFGGVPVVSSKFCCFHYRLATCLLARSHVRNCAARIPLGLGGWGWWGLCAEVNP